MQARAIVIGDVVPQRVPELADGVKGAPMDGLRFERVEQRFRVRLPVWGTPARHALPRAGACQTAAHGQTERFAAPIAMKIRPVAGWCWRRAAASTAWVRRDVRVALRRHAKTRREY